MTNRHIDYTAYVPEYVNTYAGYQAFVCNRKGQPDTVYRVTFENDKGQQTSRLIVAHGQKHAEIKARKIAKKWNEIRNDGTTYTNIEYTNELMEW